MERNEQIQKSCKIIKKELLKLNNLNCSLDLTGHTFAIFDNNIEPTKGHFGAGVKEDYKNTIVIELNQHLTKPKQ